VAVAAAADPQDDRRAIDRRPICNGNVEPFRFAFSRKWIYEPAESCEESSSITQLDLACVAAELVTLLWATQANAKGCVAQPLIGNTCYPQSLYLGYGAELTGEPEAGKAGETRWVPLDAAQAMITTGEALGL
jgi:hypothetical protein